MITRLRALALAALLLVVAACSTVDTSPAQVALHYSGGSWESQSFVECVPTGTQQNFNSPGDHYYYYPTGQRDYRFKNEPGADSGPIKVTSKDQVELTVSGSLTFDFAARCDKEYVDKDGRKWPGGILQKFHEDLDKNGAAATDDGEPMTGAWGDILRMYIGDTLDRIADNEALKFTTAELNASEAKKGEWEKAVLDALPKRLNERTGGEAYFTITTTSLQKPDIPDSLKAVITAGVEVAQKGANAEAERKIGDGWPGGMVAYQEYLSQQAINKAITDGKASIVITAPGQAVIPGVR